MQGDDSENGDDDETGPEPTGDVARVDSPLSLDAVLSLLAHHQRRDLLDCFYGTTTHATPLDECVEHIMEREEQRSGERPAHDQVEAALHHIHIPKLTDAGVLDYDPRTQTIRYWGHDRLERWLKQINDDDSEPN